MLRLLRSLAVFGAALLATLGPALADEPLQIVIHNHHFEPEQLAVPKGVKFKLLVKNVDATAEEFESSDLRREKIVAPGGEVTVSLGPLDSGQYKFFGDFHQDTAQGVLVAQ